MGSLPAHVHLALLAAVAPRWEGFMAGLRDEAREHDVADRVHFLPPRSPNELISYASGADAGVIPLRDVSANIHYCMPNKLMEMIMARLPVAVTALPDMAGLVSRHGIGATFDAEDPRSIAAAIARLLDDGAHSRFREQVARAAEELSWEREARPYVELFERWATAPPTPTPTPTPTPAGSAGSG
jgi:glycosyltransferase involved in cell wall biosynthesis